MCNAVSGFVDDKGRVTVAHPSSHSGTQEAIGLPLSTRERLSEYEWERGGDLVVRHTDKACAAARRAALLNRYPTRDALIEATRPLWEAHGHYLVKSQADADRLPADVPGDLIWESPATAPQLTGVGGHLYLSSLTALPDGAFGALTGVGGHLYLSSLTALPEGAFGALTSVGGSLWLDTLTVLPEGAFGALASVGVALWLNSLTALPDGAFGALTIVGGALLLNSLTALPDGAFGALTIVGGALLLDTLNESDKARLRGQVRVAP